MTDETADVVGQAAEAEPATNVKTPRETLADVTNAKLTRNKGNDAAADGKARAPPVKKQRGPPEDGVASKTKVMVANLPYDLREDKVSHR